MTLFPTLAFDPFSDVSWTVVYDCHGWNRLKTTINFLNEKKKTFVTVIITCKGNVHSRDYFRTYKCKKRKPQILYGNRN